MVTVGGEACTDVIVSSDTSMSCLKPAGPVGSHRPLVEFPGFGYATYSQGVTNTIDYTLTITNITPSVGSIAGGTSLTINGTGFMPEATNVNVAGNPCDVQSVTGSQILCLTAAGSDGDNTTNVEVLQTSAQSNQFSMS